MASLTEHVMINKLGDDLDEAITFVGGDTSSVTNIMQYPQIIKDQLNSANISLKEIILEGDSAIIIADETGRDEYNTSYAVGVKTGLNPGAYYIRICTAVKDIEPVYIDLTPIMDQISLEDDIQTIFTKIINLETRVSNLEKDSEDNIDEIAEKVFDKIIDEVTDEVTKTIEETFVSDSELEEMMFSIDELEKILTI